MRLTVTDVNRRTCVTGVSRTTNARRRVNAQLTAGATATAVTWVSECLRASLPAWLLPRLSSPLVQSYWPSSSCAVEEEDPVLLSPSSSLTTSKSRSKLTTKNSSKKEIITSKLYYSTYWQFSSFFLPQNLLINILILIFPLDVQNNNPSPHQEILNEIYVKKEKMVDNAY